MRAKANILGPYARYIWNSHQVLAYLRLTKKYSHQAHDIHSQPGLCGMVGLQFASNAKYIGVTQTIVEPRRENPSILTLVCHEDRVGKSGEGLAF